MFTYVSWIDSTAEDFEPQFDSFLELIARVSPHVGGVFPLSVMNGLLHHVGYFPGETLEDLASNGTDSIRYYRFPDDFPQRLVNVDTEVVAEIARRWTNDELFELNEVNGFDLYGFLLELKELCENRPKWGVFLGCAIDPN